MKNLYKYVVIGLLALSPFSAFAMHTVAHIDERIAQIQSEIKEIIGQIESLQQQQAQTQQLTLTTTPKFSLNDKVVSTSNLRVRSSTSTSGTSLAIILQGTKGVITGGPTSADGYIWWKVDWPTGEDGWSVENYLEKASAEQEATPQREVILKSKIAGRPASEYSHSPTIRISSGDSVDMAWQIRGMDVSKCRWTSGFSHSPIATAGDISTGPLTTNTTYTLSCVIAPGVSFSDSVQVVITSSTSGQTETRSAITVLSPTSGEQVEAGKPYTVRWTISNKPSDAKIMISILNNLKYSDPNNLIVLVPTKTPNDNNSETITIPKTLTPGSNYIISVTCASTAVSCYGGDSGSFTITAPSTTTTPPVSPQTTFTFSHNNQTLVAGQNSWTFLLQNAKVGDKLTVVALKDGKLVESGKQLDVCVVISGTSCASSAIPTVADVGKWIEVVYINGVEKGQVSFNVVSPASTTTIDQQSSLLALPTSINFSAVQGGSNPLAQTLAVAGTNINWVANTSSNPAGWLSLSSSSGRNSVSISIFANQFGLTAGTYSGTIVISGPGVPSVNIPVTLVVSSTATQTQTQTTQPTVSFSPNGGTVIAGQDSWTFTLLNAKSGDELSVIVSKDGVRDVNPVFLCKSFLASCVKSGTPSLSDVGSWVEEILINGVSTGQKISFNVKAPSSPPLPPVSAITGVSFSFSHNGAQMIAGKDTWTMNVIGLKVGDEVWVDAWKDGVSLGKFKICDVPVTSSPISASSCGSSGTPTDTDKGNWEEALIVKRGTTESIVAQRGAIKFNVVLAASVNVGLFPSTPTTPSASFTFSHNGATMIAGRDSWNFSLINANIGDTLEVNAYKDGAYSGRYIICTVTNGSSCSFGATPGAGDAGLWKENVLINGIEKGVIEFKVTGSASFSGSKNFASVIYALIETLGTISKQLDLLK